MLWLSTTTGARLKEAKADLAVLTPAGPSVSMAARMTPKRTERGGPREHRPPMTVEVGHDLVVRLRPIAARRDVPLARLIRDVLDVLGEEPGLVGAILDSEKTSAEASRVSVQLLPL
jgi:hypothetical protein